MISNYVTTDSTSPGDHFNASLDKIREEIFFWDNHWIVTSNRPTVKNQILVVVGQLVDLIISLKDTYLDLCLVMGVIPFCLIGYDFVSTVLKMDSKILDSEATNHNNIPIKLKSLAHYRVIWKLARCHNEAYGSALLFAFLHGVLVASMALVDPYLNDKQFWYLVYLLEMAGLIALFVAGVYFSSKVSKIENAYNFVMVTCISFYPF